MLPPSSTSDRPSQQQSGDGASGQEASSEPCRGLERHELENNEKRPTCGFNVRQDVWFFHQGLVLLSQLSRTGAQPSIRNPYCDPMLSFGNRGDPMLLVLLPAIFAESVLELCFASFSALQLMSGDPIVVFMEEDGS